MKERSKTEVGSAAMKQIHETNAAKLQMFQPFTITTGAGHAEHGRKEKGVAEKPRTAVEGKLTTVKN